MSLLPATNIVLAQSHGG